MSLACVVTAARSRRSRSACSVPEVQKALQKASLSVVAERMVSVRPCLKPEVEADSYVDAGARVSGAAMGSDTPEWPYMRKCASWKAICSVPAGACQRSLDRAGLHRRRQC